MANNKETLRNGFIPIKPFLSVVDPLIARSEWEIADAHCQRPGTSDHYIKRMSPMDQLSLRSGVSRRGLARIWNQSKTIQFHTADRILCALYAAHLWHSPPLDEFYWKVNVGCKPRIKNAA